MTTRDDLIQHEAAHAAAAVLLGRQIKAIQLRADGTGSVTFPRPDIDPACARDLMMIGLVGGIVEEAPGWPPAWPLRKDRSTDEGLCAVLSEYLKLDAKGWSQAVGEARQLTCSPHFSRLETVFGTALQHNLRPDGGAYLDRKHVAELIGVAMQHKAVTATTTTTDLGQFEALAACYSIDRTGDRIIPGAFAKTIAAWRASHKTIPLHYDHRGGDPQYIIGYVDPAKVKEITAGLFIAGHVDLEGSEIGREAWRVMKSGAMAVSFGYLEASPPRKRSDGGKDLLALDVFEFSVTPAPMSPDTRFLSLKSESAMATYGDVDLREQCRALGVNVPSTEELRRKRSMKARQSRELVSEAWGMVLGVPPDYEPPEPEPTRAEQEAELRRQALELTRPPRVSLSEWMADNLASNR